MRVAMRRFLVLPVLLLLLVSAAAMGGSSAGRKVQSDDVDEAVIYVPRLPTDRPIVVYELDTENADLGTGANPKKKKYRILAQEMKETAPPLLRDTIRRGIEVEKLMPSVVGYEEGMKLKPGTIRIHGSFTELNPGSQGKRFWVGLGAGKSRICVDIRIDEVGGDTLGEIRHCRVGVMGFTGGKSERMMDTDIRNTGVRIVEFLLDWAQGKHAH